MIWEALAIILCCVSLTGFYFRRMPADSKYFCGIMCFVVVIALEMATNPICLPAEEVATIPPSGYTLTVHRSPEEQAVIRSAAAKQFEQLQIAAKEITDDM